MPRNLLGNYPQDDNLVNIRKNPRLSKLDQDAPIVLLVNSILTQAVEEGCSDIHIEP
ncbi:MAG TPA: type II/IV secretion system protein, partial [Syntrophomonas wolfei]|nr:type II/IV secretion system protein [Syntrophomonas wolfei]